jgi:hypothetical protein
MLGDSCHFMPDFKEMEKKGFIRLERRHVYFRERKRKEKKRELVWRCTQVRTFISVVSG